MRGRDPALRGETPKRKTLSLSIRVTPEQLTWLAAKANAEGCCSLSEYTRKVLFRSSKLRGENDNYRIQIAHLEKDVEDLRQDIGKLWSQLGSNRAPL